MAELRPIFSPVNSVSPVLFQGPSSKAQNCVQRESEGKGWGSKGAVEAFPGLS